MAVYAYTAKNIAGKTVTGTVDARAQDVALGLLKDQGLYVVSISEQKESLFQSILNFRGVPQGDVVTFTRQFSTMVSAGLPISRALDVLAAQTPNQNFKKVIYEMLRAIEGGASLSVAIGKYPAIFSTTYQSLVKAGESSGKLEVILKRLADNMEASRDLNSKFKSAMVYPVIVMVAMVVVFVILMVGVVPKLADMYKSMNVPLPLITQFMIGISNFMVNYLLLIAVVVVAAFLLVRYFLTTEEGKYLFAQVFVSVPIFGKINTQKDYAQFSRTLSLLLDSAVPIVESLNIVSTVVTNPYFKKAVLEGAHQIEKGISLSTFFKSNTLFPPLLSQMASVGEETGKMNEVLDHVAVYYEGEVDNLVRGLSAALEPIILVVLGTMVGFLIVSIITPIYKITSSI